MLATTRAGHPRVLIQQDGSVVPGGKDYHYAACDDACDQPASWRIGYVTSTWGTELDDAFLGNRTLRGFALDGQDRPGFVFYDRNYVHAEPDHLGGFYAWCEADCESGTPDAPTWQEVRIGGGEPSDTDIYTLPALRYTSDGRPRIVVEVTTGDAGMDRMGIIYKACDAECDRPASWTHTRVAERGYENDVSWDLALDADDHPHIAFYQGSLEDGGGNRLSWLSCTSDCADPAQWRSLDLGLERGEGESPDIEIQPDGRPAISYLHGGGSGRLPRRAAWPTATRRAAGGRPSWTRTRTSRRISRWLDHSRVTRVSGMPRARASRSTGPGRMRVVYEAAYQARCLYEDPERPDDPPYYQFHEVNHAVRILIWDEAGSA